jgi:hypothetical protein
VKNVPGRKTDPLTELAAALTRSADGRVVWWLTSPAMITGGDAQRDLSLLVVPLRRSLEATGDLFEPHRLTDPAGCVAGPAAAYLREVAASERAAATQRSYGMDLLRWFRFRFWWAVEVPWDQATRAEARDFLCWIQLADKPSRSHWRYPGGGAPCRGGKRQVPGSPNPVTGKPPRGRGYAAATVADCEIAPALPAIPGSGCLLPPSRCYDSKAMVVLHLVRTQQRLAAHCS